MLIKNVRVVYLYGFVIVFLGTSFFPIRVND